VTVKVPASIGVPVATRFKIWLFAFAVRLRALEKVIPLIVPLILQSPEFVTFIVIGF